LSAIEFDDEVMRKTNEVDDKLTDRSLPAKLETLQLLGAENAP
jgi:hypothetical protein